MKAKTYNSKPVKAATKNMSIRLKDVSKETLEQYLDATQTSIDTLEVDTGDSAFSRFYPIKRTGQKITDEGLVPFENDEKIVNIVSERYSLAQHKEVFKNIIDVLDDNSIKYSIPSLYIDQKENRNRIYGQITFDDVKVDIDGSPTSPTVDVYNSTDGGLAAGMIFGAYRFKCSNGMMIGSEFETKKIIHTPSFFERLNFGKVYEQVMMEFKELCDSIEKMQMVKIDSVMLQTLAKLGFNKAFIKNYPVIVEKYMLDKNEDLKKDTLWALYNTATNFISNHLMLKNYADALKHQEMLHRFRIMQQKKVA